MTVPKTVVLPITPWVILNGVQIYNKILKLLSFELTKLIRHFTAVRTNCLYILKSFIDNYVRISAFLMNSFI